MRLISAATLAATFLAIGSSAAEAQAAALYPDLRTLPPRDLRLDRADVSVEGTGAMHNVLRFSNTPVNVGDGPLVLTGKIASSTRSGAANQRIFNSDGTSTLRPSGQYYYHAEHQHYHYEDWGRYELWTRAEFDAWVAAGRTGEGPFRTGTKTTSCALDEEFVASLPGTPSPGVYEAAACSPNSTGVMTQGISVGWGDTYDYYRFEQWIDLGQTTLEDGEYVLRSVADPLNKIHESPDGADPDRESPKANEAITPFSVSNGALVDTSAPSGTVAINGVNAETTSTNVKLKVLGRDDISGVDQVRLSNDGSTWSSGKAYTGNRSHPMSIDWSLSDSRYGGTAATGMRTVYVQFRDRTGKWSASETDSIRLGADDGLDGGTGSGSTYANTVAKDGPKAYWRLGETTGAMFAADHTAANNASYVGNPSMGAVSLLNGESDNSAVRFDGVDDHARASASSSLAFPATVSAEALIKPDALPAAGAFATIVGQPGSFSLQFNGPTLEFSVVVDGVRRRLQAPAGTITPGSRAHVVGTYDGASMRLYVNGNVVKTAPLTGALSTGSGAYVGSHDGRSEFFRGTIDEVALYTNVLGGLQVKDHYDAGIVGHAGVTSPSRLTATSGSTSVIDLGWIDNSSNETGFVIQRSRDAAFGSVQEISVRAGTTSYRDSGLSAGTTYHYRVQAISASDSSSYSNTASAQTAAAVAQGSPTPVVTTTPNSVKPALEAFRPRATQDMAVAMRRGLRMSFDARRRVTVKVTVRLSDRDARRLRLPAVIKRATLALPSGDSGTRLRLGRSVGARLRTRRSVVVRVSVRTLSGSGTPTTVTRSITLRR